MQARPSLPLLSPLLAGCFLLSVFSARCLGYEPVVQNIEGWTVRIEPRLLEQPELSSQALKALANHLQRVTYILPEERVAELQKMPIWIELQNSELGSFQYHPSRDWLLKNGHDPAMAKHVHIPKAADLIRRQTWAKHPYCIMHELAHAYHDQVLGFDSAEIRGLYEQAKAGGTYDEVLLFTGSRVKHYGMNNAKEYFAEATEAYLGVNDFYPFVRAELKAHDPHMHSFLEKTWGK